MPWLTALFGAISSTHDMVGDAIEARNEDLVLGRLVKRLVTTHGKKSTKLTRLMVAHRNPKLQQALYAELKGIQAQLEIVSPETELDWWLF